MHYLLAMFARRAARLLARETQFSAGSPIEISRGNALSSGQWPNSACARECTC